MRGLNSAAELFASPSGGRERSRLAQRRSDWWRLGNDLKAVLGNALADIPRDMSEQHSGVRPNSGGQVTQIVAAHWSGPLPPPGELEKIDGIIPGGADRLLRMAELEQASRIADAKRGQYLGWSLATAAVIAAAAVSFLQGPWEVSVALVGIPVLGAVQALIQGRKEKGGKRSVRWF